MCLTTYHFPSFTQTTGMTHFLDNGHHAHSSYFLNMHFNITLPLTHSYFQCVLNKNFCGLSSYWCLLLRHGASSVCVYRWRPPGRCEYIEKDVSNSPQRTVVQSGDVRESNNCSATRQVKRKVMIQNTVFMRNYSRFSITVLSTTRKFF